MQIFAHEDADGICSASLFKMVEPSSRVFFSKPCGLLRDLDQVGQERELVIVDIALCELTKRLIVDKVSKLGSRVVYVDHHPGTGDAFKGHQNVELVFGNVSTSELAFCYLGSQLKREAERVMLMGAIGDYEDLTPLCIDRLHRWDKRSIFLQAGILSGALEISRHDHEFHRQIVNLLASRRPPSDDGRIVSYAIKASEFEENFRHRVEESAHRVGGIGIVSDLDGPAGKGATYAAAAVGTSIGAYVDTDKRREIADISFRVVDQSVDLNRILRSVTPALGASGGGHPSACGARVPLRRLDELFQALNHQLFNNV